jgi:hypothetical protein
MNMNDKWQKGFANPYGPYVPGSKEYEGKVAARALIDQQRRMSWSAPTTYLPEKARVDKSVTDSNQSGEGGMAELSKLLCGLAFMFGVYNGAVENYEKQQFNPFVPAYHLSERGFAFIWEGAAEQDPHTLARVVATVIISPVVLSGAAGAFVGNIGTSVFHNRT